MGELIIHIDQETGAVLKVRQKLDDKQKKVLEKSPKEFIRLQKETGLITEEQEQEIQNRIEEQIESGVVTLPPLGNLYHGDPKVVRKLLEHRDTFQRIVNLPVELWQKKGNTICTIIVGGVPRKCHR